MSEGAQSTGMDAAARQDRIRDDLDALLDVVEQVHAEVRRQLESKALQQHPETQSWLREVEPRLFAQANTLEACLMRLEGGRSRLRRAMTSAVGTAAGWLEALRTGHEASGRVRDLFMALCLVLVQCRMLRTRAHLCGDEQTVSILAEQMEDLREILAQAEGVLATALSREWSDGPGFV